MGTYQRLYSDVEHEEKAKLSKRKGVDNHQCTGYAVPQIGGNLSLFTDPWVSQSLCLLGFDHGRMSNLVIREEADHLYVYRKVFRDLGRVFYNEGPRGILEFVELLFAKEDLYGLATAKERAHYELCVLIKDIGYISHEDCLLILSPCCFAVCGQGIFYSCQVGTE